MKKIKNLLEFTFNDSAGVLCSFIVVLSVTAFVWFIPISVLPCNYYNPIMIALCAILVMLALRLFVVIYKEWSI